MKAGMDAQEASDYARDKDLLGTLKGITDTDLARQLEIDRAVLASGESLEGREMESQSKALAAEVSLYQTLNAEERAIYKAENDQKIAKYNSEVQQIADAQRNAIASRANELAAAFNTVYKRWIPNNGRRYYRKTYNLWLNKKRRLISGL
jgi:hypothetical protein